MVKRKNFFSLGGFDPYYIYPGEDSDLGYRLIKNGYYNLVCVNCGAVHKFSNVSRLNVSYNHYKTKTRFLIKHFGTIYLIITPLFDFNETIIKPIINFIIKKFKKQKAEDNISIGPEEPFFKHVISIFFAPYHLLKGYLWNIAHIKETINSRNKNFLENLILKENK